MFSSEQYLNSIASERSNHLTLDRDGNVGINGIPGGELGLERTFRENIQREHSDSMTGRDYEIKSKGSKKKKGGEN